MELHEAYEHDSDCNPVTDEGLGSVREPQDAHQLATPAVTLERPDGRGHHVLRGVGLGPMVRAAHFETARHG